MITHFRLVFFLLIYFVGTEISEANQTDENQPSKIANYGFSNMCGPNCIWQIAQLFNKDVSLESIKRSVSYTYADGTSIRGMINGLDQLGFESIAIKTDIQTLKSDYRIAILLFHSNDTNHYVILDHIGDSKIRVLDGDKLVDLTFEEFRSLWDGVAILISDLQGKPDFKNNKISRMTCFIAGISMLLSYIVYVLFVNHRDRMNKKGIYI